MPCLLSLLLFLFFKPTNTKLQDYAGEPVPERQNQSGLKQETVSGSGIIWAVCKSACRSRQITMPAPHHSVFFTGRKAFLPANQQRQSTEGRKKLG